VEKWGEIEVSGGLRKIGDFIGLQYPVKTSEPSKLLPRKKKFYKKNFTRLHYRPTGERGGVCNTT
jgi:hypothetical protein